MAANTKNLFKGIWILKSRIDITKDGLRVIDPILGEDPIGILAYGETHFTAQFMKRDRSSDIDMVSFSGSNNTTATNGYDAYFGLYEVAENSLVMHSLIGSINEKNIGMVVYRSLKVLNDELTISLDTTTIDGIPITRTLTWSRA